MRRWHGRARVAPALMAAISVLSGCSPSNPTDGRAVSVGQPGGEVAAVKETMRQLSQEKSVAGMAPYLSNRSAAAMGMVMMIPIMFIGAFAEMGDKMSQDLGKLGNQGGGSTPSPSQDPKLKEVKTIMADLKTVMKKYGMEEGKQPGKDDLKKFEGRGREFLADTGALIDRFAQSEAGKGQGFSAKPDMVKKIDQFEYQVVSPTEVKIISKEKNDMPTRAIVEDGKWRLDFGGIDELGKAMGASKGAGGMTPSPFGSGGGKP